MTVFNLDQDPEPRQPAPLPFGGRNPAGETLGVNSQYLERNGRPWLPCMGEFHYSRYPRGEWERELLKMKANGIQIVATYVFWIHHEEDEGIFDWSGDRDLRHFLQLCARQELPVWLRLGPFCHGEARNGGLPDWLYGRPFAARSNDPAYLACVERLYGEIGRQAAGLLFKDGGPIIGLQCENEFMDSAAPWETTQQVAAAYTPKGSDGIGHLLALKRLAAAAGLEAPLYSVTGWGAAPIAVEYFLPVFGGYAFYSWLDDPSQQEPTGNYRFTAAHRRSHRAFDPSTVPYACCELGGGIQVFYRNRPVVPPESVEAMHVVHLGSGANLPGYYMYHGGSNPVGKHAFLNEYRCPRISYDFQAPIREFGQVAEAGHRLRRQFLFLAAFGSDLAPLPTILPEGEQPVAPTDTATLRAAVRARDGRGFVFLNNYQDHVARRDLPGQRLEMRREGQTFSVPAQGEFTLPREVCAILPLNLPLGDACLRHATVQPLTRIVRPEGDHYFFFAVPGMAPEYAFVSAGIVRLEAPGAELRQEGELTLARVVPGTGPALRLETAAGQTLWISTLTEAQSRRCWQARLAGTERVLLATADLYFPDGGIACSSTASAASLWVCPPLPLAGPEGLLASTPDGEFARYELAFVAAPVPCETTGIGSDQVLLRLPANALAGVEELLLRIAYTGDIGSAYLDGRLVHDNFANGQPWEIGLKRFARPGQALELLLRVLPRRDGGTRQVAYTSMAAIQVTEADTAAAITAVTPVPRYVLRLTPRG